MSDVAPLDECSQTNRPKQYKLWEKETVNLACDAVVSKYMRAEAEYGIPNSTLQIGGVQVGAVTGPQTLSDHEGAELVRFLFG